MSDPDQATLASPAAVSTPETGGSPGVHHDYDLPGADIALRAVSKTGKAYDFRVHKARLAQASDLFANMMDLCDGKEKDEVASLDGIPVIPVEADFDTTWPTILGHAYNKRTPVFLMDAEASDFSFKHIRDCWATSYRYQLTASQLIGDLAISNLIQSYKEPTYYEVEEESNFKLSITELYEEAKTIGSQIVKKAAWRYLCEQGPVFKKSQSTGHNVFSPKQKQIVLDNLDEKEQIQLLSSWLARRNTPAGKAKVKPEVALFSAQWLSDGISHHLGASGPVVVPAVAMVSAVLSGNAIALLLLVVIALLAVNIVLQIEPTAKTSSKTTKASPKH